MRALNHFHIFVLPFQPDNAIDLDRFTPGLQAIAENVKENQRLGRRAAELGRLYFSERGFLLHGDYFPGPWFRGGGGIRVSVPELGLAGRREFCAWCRFPNFWVAGARAPSQWLPPSAHWET